MVYEAFCRAREYSGLARESYLQSIAVKNSSLAVQVKALLQQDELKTEDDDTWSKLIDGAVQEPTELLLHKNLNAFKLVELLGHGGMAKVYLAKRHSEDFEQTVAIKVLDKQLDKIIGREALIREANVMAKLNHPNIAKIFDAGTEDSNHYIVMEHIKGQSLIDYLSATNISFKNMIDTLVQLCEGIHHAHQMQIVHADIKPSNLLIDSLGQVKIVDFGISRIFLNRKTDEYNPKNNYLLAYTKQYAAPELVNGTPPNTLTDLYAIGVVLQQVTQLYAKKMTTWQIKELKAITNKAVSVEPAKRFASADALAKDLQCIKKGITPKLVQASFFTEPLKFYLSDTPSPVQ